MPRRGVVLAAIGGASSIIGADPYGCLERALDKLASWRASLDGASDDAVVIALAPGWAALAAVPELTRRGLVRGLATHSSDIIGPLLANVGRAPLRTLPWLLLHAAQHRFVRHVKGIATERNLVFLGPTACMGHPRTHWESWPDSPHVFHQAWSLTPHHDNHAMRQSNPPDWMLRLGIMPSKSQPYAALQTGLSGTLERCALSWGDEEAPLQEPGGPAVPDEDSSGPSLQYWPRFCPQQAPDEAIRRRFKMLAPGAVALSPGLDGPSFIVGRTTHGWVIHAKTPLDPGPHGVFAATCRWPPSD